MRLLRLTIRRTAIVAFAVPRQRIGYNVAGMLPRLLPLLALVPIGACLNVVAEAGSDAGTACDVDHPCAAGHYCDFGLMSCGNPMGFSGLSAPAGRGTCRADCGSSCGSCKTDSDCSELSSCRNGSCVIGECSAMGLICPAACPASNVPHHCPVCLCTSCSSGGCPDTACRAGLSCCGGRQCSDIGSDTLNCGACGNLCLPGHQCLSSACTPAPCFNPGSCSGDQACCGAQCCAPGQACCAVNVGASTFECLNVDAGACPPSCGPGCF